MNLTIIVGFFAGALTTVSYIPQAIKVWKSKSTKDLSLITFLLLILGLSLWLTYGILLKDLPLIIANAVAISLIFVILLHKLKYK
ncbi:MAG TPA: SemiSWEET transporter [Candidatus Nanoarchaeia archaeon]|nr:SemiSWEET transporter [Candidatus Nanoarchaeia archaeon]